MQQIRITKTPQLDDILSYLKGKYPLLSDAEIIKMSLSETYYKEQQNTHDMNAVQYSAFRKRIPYEKAIEMIDSIRDDLEINKKESQ